MQGLECRGQLTQACLSGEGREHALAPLRSTHEQANESSHLAAECFVLAPCGSAHIGPQCCRLPACRGGGIHSGSLPWLLSFWCCPCRDPSKSLEYLEGNRAWNLQLMPRSVSYTSMLLNSSLQQCGQTLVGRYCEAD